MNKSQDSGVDRKRESTPSTPESGLEPLHLTKLLGADDADPSREGSELAPASAGEGVTEFVRKAVQQTLDAPGARPVLPRQAEQLSPKAVLLLISYCYAKGIYSSREIEDQLLRDPQARAELGPDLPDDRSLSRFRRLNRQLIEDTLQRVLTEAKRKSGQWPLELQPGSLQTTPHSSGTDRTENPNASQDEQPTTHLARQAAQDLLQRAMFIDGMTRDY